MKLTEHDKATINATPLIDIMTAWGYTPERIYRNGGAARYHCPFHQPDNHPSFLIDLRPREGAHDLGFICRACKESGFGAVQLAARLMGKPAGELSAHDYMEVVQEIVERCGVELESEDTSPTANADRVTFMPIEEVRTREPQYADWDGHKALYEYAPWTESCFKDLGFKVALASRRAKKDDVAAADDPDAEVKVGDLITKYDPDTGEPLYRCSLDRDFYSNPNKAQARTLQAWGDALRSTFGVVPLSRFIIRVTPAQGGACAAIVRTTGGYPVFVFEYPFGVKKYESRARIYNMKWAWWNLSDDADIEHRLFADAELAARLELGKTDEPGGRFQRVVLCSGPRDAMQVYAHSDAHVVWLLSETAGFDRKGGSMRPNRWLRAQLKRLRDVTVEGGLYVCYDEDAVGLQCSQAIALADPHVRWLRLPKELGQLTVNSSQLTVNSSQLTVNSSRRSLKDVTDFVTHFAQVEALMPADLQHDDPGDWFDNALFDTPTCQFWQWESERKDADGTGRNRYKFDLRNLPVFLRARGMVRRVVTQQGVGSFSRFFLLGDDHTYTECFAGEKGANKLVSISRDLMAEWLRAHKQHNDKKGALSRAIYAAKLDQSVLEAVELVDFDDHAYGEDFDYFYFENTAVRVDAEKVAPVSYASMKYWTNREAILEGRFSVIPQPWRVIINPQYEQELQRHKNILDTLHTAEECAQENMRWDSWVALWRYKLIMDKPLDEMPLHFRFLYNTCRIFWEKEAIGEELTAAERQMQDMYFIAAAHAIGSALVRHRSSARQQYIHITDNGTRREDLASGGTGKTAILELLGLMRRVLKVDGKSLEGSNITLTQELAKVVPGLNTIVCLDELPTGFSPKALYNITLSLTARGLYRTSMVLEGDDLPKFVVASNEQLDLSSDSTSRRTYQLLVSDYYHPRSIDGSRPAHTPADDFAEQYHVKEVARNLPAPLLNEARNLLIGCVQFFFQQPDETIRPPKDSRALMRQALAASKDEQFTRWAASYIGDRRHRCIPIAQRELAISLLDYCGYAVGNKTINAAYRRIRENLPEYIKVSQYVMNPPVVLSTPTDREDGFRRCAAWQYPKAPDGSIPVDEHGERLPRELVKKAPYSRVYYFYPRNRVPRNFFHPDHIGDPDYVQPAPPTDPDARES